MTRGSSGQERVRQEEHWCGCSAVCAWGRASENGNRPLSCPHVGSVLQGAESSPQLVETGLVVGVGK